MSLIKKVIAFQKSTVALFFMLVLLFSLSAESMSDFSPSTKNFRDNLDQILLKLPSELSSRIASNRAEFEGLLTNALVQDSDLTVLVDKQHNLPAEYMPKDLVRLDGVRPRLSLNKGSIPLQLRSITIRPLQEMALAAKKEGVTIVVSSAFRSYTYQKNLFARYVKELGLAEAERQSAHAGSSQHQLGLALDFGSITPEFASDPAGKWLAIHAYKYGFSLSYPRGAESHTGYMYEPWHFRFIGKEACLLQEQFFASSQQDVLTFIHDYGDKLRTPK